MSKLNRRTKLSKKETRKIVFKKISTALGEYSGELNDKKVAKNLRRLSKVLADNVVRSARKQNGKEKASKNKTLTQAEQPAKVLQSTN